MPCYKELTVKELYDALTPVVRQTPEMPVTVFDERADRRMDEFRENRPVQVCGGGCHLLIIAGS
jgi:hypothetical protein